jgi:glycosyltransferase involved in cell wall biosynthesis
MHVLIVALHRPLKPTGVCRYAANLAQSLAETKQIDKVTLVVGAWQTHYFLQAFSLESPKIWLESVDIKNSSLSRNLWFMFGLPQFAKKINPDLVHLSFPLPFWRSRFFCPVVATIHDLYPYECPENFGYQQVLFNRFFLEQCIRESDGLTCVSKTTLESLKHYFPKVFSKKPISIAYNSVDFSTVIPKPPVQFKDALTSAFLLTVGQHRKNKNLDILIRAFALLLQTGQLDAGIRLIIVGSPGPETDNLSLLITQLALIEHVLMLSSIDDNELCWLYQHCQVFIIPSATEGFCLPLAEALYLSCRVVCSAIPIFREVGSNSCVYFELQGDAVSNLATAVKQVLNQRHPDSTSGDQRFSKTVAAQQHLELYCRLSITAN